MLIAHKAQDTLVNNQGLTPWDLARNNGHAHLVTLLTMPTTHHNMLIINNYKWFVNKQPKETERKDDL